MATKRNTKSSAGTVASPETAPAPSAPAEAVAATIPLDSIEVMKGWNIRTDFPQEELDKLAASIAEIGQLAPVVVMRNPKKEGRFLLVAGERRCRAIDANAQKSGDKSPTVKVLIIDPATAKQATVEENFKRDGVSHADRCRFVASQLEAGMPVAHLAKLLGVSESVIYTDKGIATGLAPEIFSAWAKFPKASKIALRIYAKPVEEQRKLWEEWRSGQSEDKPKRAKKGEASEGAEGEASEDTAKKPSKSNLSTMYRELTGLADWLGEGHGPDHSWLAGATWALEYMANGGSVPAHIAALIERKNAPPKQRELFPKHVATKVTAVPSPAGE